MIRACASISFVLLQGATRHFATSHPSSFLLYLLFYVLGFSFFLFIVGEMLPNRTLAT
jgi:hypothetical protein